MCFTACVSSFSRVHCTHLGCIMCLDLSVAAVCCRSSLVFYVFDVVLLACMLLLRATLLSVRSPNDECYNSSNSSFFAAVCSPFLVSAVLFYRLLWNACQILVFVHLRPLYTCICVRLQGAAIQINGSKICSGCISAWTVFKPQYLLSSLRILVGFVHFSPLSTFVRFCSRW